METRGGALDGARALDQEMTDAAVFQLFGFLRGAGAMPPAGRFLGVRLGL